MGTPSCLPGRNTTFSTNPDSALRNFLHLLGRLETLMDELDQVAVVGGILGEPGKRAEFRGCTMRDLVYE